MCLAAWADAQSPRFAWVMASNRDEFLDRPAAPLGWWADTPAGGAPIAGGRDLASGGTWLALNAAGRLAFVTNVRDPGRFDPTAPSRGDLVPLWLRGGLSDPAEVDAVARVPRNGFNLLLADLLGGGCRWVTNRPPLQRELPPGLYGLSNAALDTPWPKLVQIKRRLAAAVCDSPSAEALVDAAFEALADRRPAADADLPSTGVALPREREMSSAFVRTLVRPAAGAAERAYGTRCSTVVVLCAGAGGPWLRVVERSFDAAGAISGEVDIGFRPSGSRPTGNG